MPVEYANPVAEIHPADAAHRGITHDQHVRVYNERSTVCLKARLNASLKPSVVVISEGSWVRDFPEGDPYSLTHEWSAPPLRITRSSIPWWRSKQPTVHQNSSAHDRRLLDPHFRPGEEQVPIGFSLRAEIAGVISQQLKR
jgi:anaerobic selenocysteine-containing dehydrogenase